MPINKLGGLEQEGVGGCCHLSTFSLDFFRGLLGGGGGGVQDTMMQHFVFR